MSAKIEATVLGMAHAFVSAIVASGLASGDLRHWGYWIVVAYNAFFAVTCAAKLAVLSAEQ